MREHGGSALSYISQPTTPTLLGIPDLMDEEDGDDEIKIIPTVLVPEVETLSEVHEVAHWSNDLVPVVHCFCQGHYLPWPTNTNTKHKGLDESTTMHIYLTQGL